MQVANNSSSARSFSYVLTYETSDTLQRNVFAPGTQSVALSPAAEGPTSPSLPSTFTKNYDFDQSVLPVINDHDSDLGE